MANVKAIVAAHLSQRQRNINQQAERADLLGVDRLLCNIIRVGGVIDVAGRPGFVWCQEYSPSADTSPFHAFNDKVQAREGLNVWIGDGLGGRREVLDWNNSTIINTSDYDAQKYQPKHASDHAWPDAKPGPDALNVYPRSLTMLRAYPGEAGLLTVSVASLRYIKDGALVTFPGTNSLDISASQPASGLALFVGLYLDWDDNTVKIIAGATTSDSPAITPDSPTFPSSAIHSVMVRLDGDQTTVSEVDFVDARQVLAFSGPGAVQVSEIWESDFGAVAMAADATGNITLNGTRTLTIPTDIIHAGDADTKISFTDDDIELTAGGLSMLKLTETAQDVITLGPGAGDVDIDFNGDMFLQGSDGYLSIGTITPISMLTVEDVNAVVGTLTNTAASSSAQGAFMILASNDGAATASGDRLGGFGFKGQATIAAGINGAVIAAFADGAWGPGDTPTRLEFEVAADGSSSRTTRLKIENDGLSTFTGNIAAFRDDTATLTPQLLLEQDGTGDALLGFLLTATRSYQMGIDNSDGDKFKLAEGADGLGVDTILTFTPAGEMGIGTTSPTAQLHIDQSSTTAAQPVLLLDQGDLSEEVIKYSSDGVDRDIVLDTIDVTGTPTRFWDESEDAYSQNKGLIVTAGDVGVGIAPTEKLHVYEAAAFADMRLESGSDNFGGRFILATPTGNDPVIGVYGTGYVAVTEYTNKLVLQTNSRDIALAAYNTGDEIHFYTGGRTSAFKRVVIDGTGRVGIKVAAPLAQLHIDQLGTATAIPVLLLDQADISEEMIEFNTTIGTGNAIEAIGGKTLTTTHFIKVTIPGGLTRYIPVGTIA